MAIRLYQLLLCARQQVMRDRNFLCLRCVNEVTYKSLCKMSYTPVDPKLVTRNHIITRPYHQTMPHKSFSYVANNHTCLMFKKHLFDERLFENNHKQNSQVICERHFSLGGTLFSSEETKGFQVGETVDADFRNDPEIKGFLKEITEDFSQKNPDMKSSDDSSSGSSDSDSSDSESDSSDSDSNQSDSIKNSVNVGVKRTTEQMAIDIDRELLRYDYEEFDVLSEGEEEETEEPIEEQGFPFSLERGTTGVFDVKDMVSLLREDNAQDVCAIAVPKEVNYVDYMVIATGKSVRHLKAMAEFIKKVYKLKRKKGDAVTVVIEGQDSLEWLAMDLGNMAVHLFTASIREKYDLETLWTVGPKYDSKTREQDGTEELPLFWETSATEFVQPKAMDVERPLHNTSKLSEHELTIRSMENWHKR